MSHSFTRLLTIPFTTLRPPPKVNKQQGESVPHLVAETLRCAPLDPVDADTARHMREQLGRAMRLLETYTPELDIADGDVLEANSRAYPVRRVERWDWRGTTFLRLLLEEL
jgi:hypothetical protein